MIVKEFSNSTNRTERTLREQAEERRAEQEAADRHCLR